MFYEKTTLDNGVTVITEKMPDVRSITMGYWFQVGSRDEQPEQAGMSHFMEHMMFKGTGKRDALGISAAFEGLGAELNAFTSHEYTCYYARFIDDKLEQAMEIMSDMLCHSLYSTECCRSEREVVIEEIARSEDTPEDHVWDLFEGALLPTHPLGRPVIGTREIVGGFDHGDCVSYHEQHYRSGNLVIVLTGNIDHSQAVRLVERNLADLQVLPREERSPLVEGLQHPFAFLHRDTEQSHVIYGLTSYPAGHPDRFATALLECALGGGMSSRLFQEVREKRGLAYAVFCQVQDHTDLGKFAVYAGTRPANLQDVVHIIERVVDEVAADGITEEELTRVRDYATGQTVLAMESTRARMTRLGKAATMGQPLISLDEMLAAYNAVTVDDIARVASDLLDRKKTLAVIGPQSEDDLAKMFG